MRPARHKTLDRKAGGECVHVRHSLSGNQSLPELNHATDLHSGIRSGH